MYTLTALFEWRKPGRSVSDEAERSMISKLKSHLEYLAHQHGGEQSFFSYYTNTNILSNNMMYVYNCMYIIVYIYG